MKGCFIEGKLTKNDVNDVNIGGIRLCLGVLSDTFNSEMVKNLTSLKLY